MHLTGDYVSNSSEFSSSKWLSTAEIYLNKIKNNLTSDNWMSIFQALHHLEESDARDDRIQIGAPLLPSQHEALLPADPVTPPPLD